MVLIVRTLEKCGVQLNASGNTALTQFKDYQDISGYARAAVAALVKSGVITGNGNYLNPNANITRAEIAAILYRILAK